MKFRKNKFLTTIAAVTLALAVGACSSNGDDEMSDMDMAPPATTDPAPEPTPELTPAEQLTAAQGLVAAAQVMVAALTENSTAEDAAAAYAALGAAQTALHAANSLPENQIAAKQAEIDVLQAQVDQLKIDLAEATKEPEGPTAAMIAATMAAGTKATAINAEAAQGGADNPDAGIGGDVATGDATTYLMAIERPRAGTVVKITDSANAMEDDPKFAQAMDFGDGRTMHVRTMEADDDGNVVEEVVIVSTDIAAPTATAFAKVVGQTLDARDLDDEVNADNTGTATDDWTALAVDQSEEEVRKLVKSSAFTAGTAAVLSFARFQMDSDNTMDGDQTVKAFETAGTYNGAMGTYRCNATDADCTVTLDTKGAITAMTVGWVFTPDAGATSDVADANYLSYGFWLKRTTDGDDVLTYNEVETFATATGPGHPETGGSDVGMVVGSATYEGSAVGVYVKNVLDDEANITTATSGHFTADVELNADFGGGGVAANDQFTIGGKITGFVLQHGEDNDWGVGLGLADFSGRTAGNEPGKSGPGNSHDNEFSGVATGDSTAAAGSWNGMFYGSSAEVDHDMDDTTDEIRYQPVAVIGEFNANFTDGTTAGAYGANK